MRSKSSPNLSLESKKDKEWEGIETRRLEGGLLLGILHSSKLFRRRGSEFLCVLTVPVTLVLQHAELNQILTAGARDRGRFSGQGALFRPTQGWLYWWRCHGYTHNCIRLVQELSIRDLPHCPAD